MERHFIFIYQKTIILRCQYSSNLSTDSFQSIIKKKKNSAGIFFFRNWKADCKIHMEIQVIQNTLNNFGKENIWRNHIS